MYIRWIGILLLRIVLLAFQLLAFIPVPIAWILFRTTGKGNWFCPVEYRDLEDGEKQQPSPIPEGKIQAGHAPNGKDHEEQTPGWLKILGLYYGESFHFLVCFAWCVGRNPTEWFWKFFKTHEGEVDKISEKKTKPINEKPGSEFKYDQPPSYSHKRPGKYSLKYLIEGFEKKYFLYAWASKWGQIHLGWYPNGRHVAELKGVSQIILWMVIGCPIIWIVYKNYVL